MQNPIYIDFSLLLPVNNDLETTVAARKGGTYRDRLRDTIIMRANFEY